MLSIQYQFLFIHIPKTGGNSIQNVLRHYSEDKIISPESWQDGFERFEVKNPNHPFSKHTPNWKYRQHLPENLYKELFRFATIRNPWDMMVSWYFSPHRRVTEFHREQFKSLIQSVRRGRWFLRSQEPNSSGNSLPTSEPTRTGCPSYPMYWDVDFLLRFEYLNEDFQHICKRIGIANIDLPKRNKSLVRHQDFRNYYDDDLVDLVAEKFSDEIEFGNYQFDGNSESVCHSQC